jgi:hypothetical protein
MVAAAEATLIARHPELDHRLAREHRLGAFDEPLRRDVPARAEPAFEPEPVPGDRGPRTVVRPDQRELARVVGLRELQRDEFATRIAERQQVIGVDRSRRVGVRVREHRGEQLGGPVHHATTRSPKRRRR